MMSFTEGGALISFNERSLAIFGQESANGFTMQSLFSGTLPNEPQYRGDLRFTNASEEVKILGVTASKVFSPEFSESIWGHSV